ncbi:MAG: ribonuclease E/G, partial [Pseudomonadota bacterium]
MLIDATHPEETRVVVVDGNKVDDFDFESVNKKQLAGNIYLAKVTRVEPSLQAAFVDYGGNRHGFLAFAEIHPDYYQIPVADREALIAEEAAIAAREAENEDEGRRGRSRRGGGRRLKNGSEGADDAVKSDTDVADPEGSEEDSAQESGRPSRSSRSRRGRGRKQVSPPVAEDNGITGFGVIDPEGGGLDGAPEPNAGQQVAAAETAEAKAEVGAAEQAETATDDHGGVAEIATNGDSEQAAESDIATAAADDAPEEGAAAEDAGDALETAEEPTTEVAEAEAPSDEDEAPEDGSEPDGPPRTIAESAGLEGEDEVVRGDVPSSEGGNADEAAPAEEAAEKPKPRRRRRTTKKAEEAPAEAATSDAAVAESAGSAAPAVESAVAPGEESAEPVSAESEAPEAAEAASEEASTGTSTETATETATEDTSEGSSEAAGEAASEAATGAGDAAPEATAAGETSSEESPSKPRRSRRGGKRSKKSEAKAAEDAPGDVETASEAEADGEEPKSRRSDGDDDGEATEGGDIDTVGAEDLQEEDLAARAIRRRRYKIQDVVKSRQIMLVQVVKEERGTKGAALTTYLSLAGRYCVLMPNTARGGGISRKITNASDRKRLREIVGELEVPQGMGLIVRTAGAERTRAEIKRDYEFLLRQWEQIRELTLRSTAPCLIYEEGSLIKRSIR